MEKYEDLGLGLAEHIAMKYHAGQMYGIEPYTAHLFAVRDAVAGASTDERLQVVAVLHDILEDTDCDLLILNTLFEDNIVAAVVAMTKKKGQQYVDYISQVKANSMARVVKCFDTLCNLNESMKRSDLERVKKYSTQLNLLVSE